MPRPLARGLRTRYSESNGCTSGTGRKVPMKPIHFRQFALPLVLVLAALPAQVSADAPQSAQSAQSAPAQNPSQPQARPQADPAQDKMLRADILMARKRFQEAINVYKELLRRDPKNAVLLNKIGIAYTQLSNLNEARRYYERAIKADKFYPEAVNNLGTVYYQQGNISYKNKRQSRAKGQYERAVAYYRQALQMRENMASVHSNLGYALFALGRYEEAFPCFQRALELDPEVLERRSTGGTLLQDRTVAERSYFYFFVAKSYAAMKNPERCAHYLKRALEEGYKGLADLDKDPAFAAVINDPQVQEVLALARTAAPTPARRSD